MKNEITHRNGKVYFEKRAKNALKYQNAQLFSLIEKTVPKYTHNKNFRQKCRAARVHKDSSQNPKIERQT